MNVIRKAPCPLCDGCGYLFRLCGDVERGTGACDLCLGSGETPTDCDDCLSDDHPVTLCDDDRVRCEECEKIRQVNLRTRRKVAAQVDALCAELGVSLSTPLSKTVERYRIVRGHK